MKDLEKIRVAVKSEEVILRDPKTKELITVEGNIVRKTAFWLRRLKSGDCIELPLENNETPKTIEREENGDIIQ
jgi:hypothetical protein